MGAHKLQRILVHAVNFGNSKCHFAKVPQSLPVISPRSPIIACHFERGARY